MKTKQTHFDVHYSFCPEQNGWVIDAVRPYGDGPFERLGAKTLTIRAVDELDAFRRINKCLNTSNGVIARMVLDGQLSFRVVSGGSTTMVTENAST
jgi:hypothetical protein